MSATERFIRDAGIEPDEFPGAVLKPQTWLKVEAARGWRFHYIELTYGKDNEQVLLPWIAAWDMFYFMLRRGFDIETVLLILELLHERQAEDSA